MPQPPSLIPHDFPYTVEPAPESPQPTPPKHIPPTLITEFSSGYNFSNNFLNSPLVKKRLAVTPSKVRTQPSSFSENFEPPAAPKEESSVISSLPLSPRSTLLERDFPAEILPFELLSKIDGRYAISAPRSGALDNYGALYDDSFVDNRVLRVRTQKRIAPGVLHDAVPHAPRPRTYSESETANFSTITGERLYDDDKHRPFALLHGAHEKLEDDLIHAPLRTLLNPSRNSRSTTPQPIPGGMIVPDESYTPSFLEEHTYNRDFGLAKTHQISTSTLALLQPRRLHPNVAIYNNYECLLGCEDEYIPGLDFENSVGQWFDNDDDFAHYAKQISKPEMPNHCDNPVLTESAHDYKYSEIAGRPPLNQNLSNYQKSILAINENDYDGLHGGHKKLPQMPQFIRDSQPPFRETPQKSSKNVRFEFGTVIDNLGSGSSTVASSPIIAMQLKKDRLEKAEPSENVSEEPAPVKPVKKSELIDLEEDSSGKVNYEKLIDQLPDNFLELPFSRRRKVLLLVLPPNDENNKIDLKLLLQLIKNRFSKKGSGGENQSSSAPAQTAATKFLSRVSKAPTKKHNIDDRGAVVLNHELGKIIGYGSWGIVRECYSLSDEFGYAKDDKRRLVRAIKIVKTKNEVVRKCFKKEIRIWRLLNHKRLLPLLYVKETSYAIFCITPRIYGGTLFDIVSSWGYFSDPKSPIAIPRRLRLIRKFVWEILDGLSYMHYSGIVHGDLKLENCLIDEIVNPVTGKIENHILICDFGMSCFYIDPERSKLNSVSSARSSLSKLSALSLRESPVARSKALIPRSVSSENLSVLFNKMHKILFNRALTHDDTPAGISSFPKSYGPAPTLASLNLAPISFNYIQNEQATDDKTPLPHTHIGSLPYASPEILMPNPPPLGPMADIWAFGVLLYTMVVGKLPFQHNFEPRLRAMISRGKYDADCLTKAAEGAPEIVEIVKGCLTKDILPRWDLDKIVDVLALGGR